MRLTDILSVERITLDPVGSRFNSGEQILTQLATSLCSGIDCDQEDVLTKLREREKLQSTGIGDGVAIPHTAIELSQGQRAAVVLSPRGVEFDSIDQQPVHIFLGVIGPKSEASAHLKILAKVSRLLRSPETRRRLLESTSPEQAYSLIEEHERSSDQL